MNEFGYKLMSEEHGAAALVDNAQRAEAAGFDFVAISDHYHPWIDVQGHATFAWSVLGAIARETSRVGLATAVTCPHTRYHPAIVAQAAATVALLSDGRFTLGVGAGEQLNEHVVGASWPGPHVRQEKLAEAIDVIRLLWQGGTHSYRGEHIVLDRARLFDVPDEPPQIVVAAGGPEAAELAAQKGDGIVCNEANAEVIRAWRDAGGDHGSPAYGEIALCWAKTEDEAIDTAHRFFRWSTSGWSVLSELPDPESFAAASQSVGREQIAQHVACGPDPERHLQAIRKYLDAGFDHPILLGIGPDQEGFIRFWEKELAPKLH